MSCEGFLRDSPRLGLEGRNRNTTSELAEGVGFEPTVPCDTTVFETVRFVRSRIPPSGLSCSYSLLALVFCPNSGTVQPWEHEVPMVQARCASARLVRVVGNSEPLEGQIRSTADLDSCPRPSSGTPRPPSVRFGPS